jgi:hypothetical protein
MEMGSMGEAKTLLWWLQIRGWRCPHELGFLPLYSLSDSRLPILGRNGAGLSRPSGLGKLVEKRALIPVGNRL